jgi:hypothetical protein
LIQNSSFKFLTYLLYSVLKLLQHRSTWKIYKISDVSLEQLVFCLAKYQKS